MLLPLVNTSGGGGILLLLLMTAQMSQWVAAQMAFLATGDWGGQTATENDPRYYNDVEMANANAMAGLMADPGLEVVPSLGLLMGDNFYGRGISCDNDPMPGCVTDSHSHRFNKTFEEVFSQPVFDDFPFYVNLGAHLPFTRFVQYWRTIAHQYHVLTPLQRIRQETTTTTGTRPPSLSMGSKRWARVAGNFPP